MKQIFIGLLSTLSSWILFGCHDAHLISEHPFDDPKIREIAQLSDDRNLEGLLPFLKANEPKYLAYAAQCLGSFGESIPTQALFPLTLSTDSLVANTAAWAIGQKGDSTICRTIMEIYLQSPKNGTLLTTLSRCLPTAPGALQTEGIDFLLSLSIDQPQSATAFVDAIYVLHYRAIYSSPLFDKLMECHLPSSDIWLRKAQAIGRYRGILSASHQRNLTALMARSMHPEMALALTSALTLIEDSMAVAFIQNKLKAGELDPRVELMYCNMILRKTRMDETIVSQLLSMNKPSLHRAILPQLVRQPISENLQNQIISMSFAEEDLYAYTLYYQTRQGRLSIADFMTHYHQVAEGYARIPWVAILAELADSHNLLFNEILSTKHLALRYALAEEWLKLQTKVNNENFNESEFAMLWDIQDIGLNALLCDCLLKVGLTPLQKTNWATKMMEYIKTLSLPQEIETYEIVRSTAETLYPQGSSAASYKSTYALNWDLIQRIPLDAQVRITTNKGTITMTLDVAAAPGSVSNFVNLVKQGFYNGKYFHRMVPNFVVQGGCPRGDGMGSTPSTLRSEFTPYSYTTGAVGLASSGRDTESCQWFISLAPTPHLEGRYTIIGYITDGMSIVSQLQVGDQIQEITPLNFAY